MSLLMDFMASRRGGGACLLARIVARIGRQQVAALARSAAPCAYPPGIAKIQCRREQTVSRAPSWRGAGGVIGGGGAQSRLA